MKMSLLSLPRNVMHLMVESALNCAKIHKNDRLMDGWMCTIDPQKLI